MFTRHVCTLHSDSCIHTLFYPSAVEGMVRPDLAKEVDRIEKAIRQRLPIGASLSARGLINELVANKGFPEHAVNRAVEIMVQQEKLLLKNQRKVVLRQR
jgi:hypothetical protein